MPMVRRGPGLLRMAAGTAVVAGTATAVSGRVARRQNEKSQSEAESQQAAAAQQVQYQQAPNQGYSSGQEGPSVSSELERLVNMRQQGLLTDEEFVAAKSKLLGS